MKTKKPLEYYLRQADLFLIKKWKLYKNIINDLTEEEQETFINYETEQTHKLTKEIQNKINTELEKRKLINIINP